MKRLLFFFLIFGATLALSAQIGCDHTIYLYDDAGDGWDGGFVDVHVNGNPVVTNFTLVSGFRYDWRTFSAPTGADIDVYYTPGNAGYAYENYYAVYDGVGASIGESGFDGYTPGSLFDLPGYCPESTPECCNHIVFLTDDYGDGWNGGYLDVFVSGALVLDQITLSSGQGQEDFFFTACSGATIDVYYHAGGWSFENAYAVYEGSGLLIDESGAGGTTPEDLRGLNGYCLPGPEVCDHSIILWDDGMNGWNGGFVDVYVDGSPVLTAFTVLSGMNNWSYFSAYTGADIDVYYTAGTSPEENSYTVLDGDGEMIDQSGVGPISPSSLFNLVGNCPEPPPESCDHQICLYDDVDDWDIAHLDVYVDGSPVLSGVSLSTGPGPVCYTFPAYTGADIDISYAAGLYPNENSYEVYDGDGTLIAESGSGGTSPESINDLVGYCPEPPPESCDHQICLYDDVDDWDIAHLDVYVDGSPVLSGISLSAGPGPVCYTFPAYTGADIDVSYAAGLYPNENSYEVYDGDGTLIAESGSGGTSPESINDLVGYCPEITPDCCDHRLHLGDAAGDGWDGGFVDVYVDGTAVLTGITLPTGSVYDWFDFTACAGSDIDVYYTLGTGGYAYENSYIVTDANGALLGESGSGTSTPGDLLNLVGNCDPLPPPDCCEHEICLSDDRGDGWNGGYVDVYVDGNLVVGSLTFTSGAGPYCHTFTACTGADIDVFYYAGVRPYEEYYAVYDGNGVMIGESGSGGAVPGDLMNLVGYCDPIPVPENDLCGDAQPITCNTSVNGTTLGATLDEVEHCGTSNTAPGVWYSFVATSSLTNLSTCNQADYDTKISVFTGSCNDLTCVGGLDDAQGCAGFTTSLDLITIPGETYLVLIHGFGSAVGDFTLTLTCNCEIIVPPQAPFENMTGNTLSVADGTDLVGWTCNNSEWQITSPAHLQTIEYTAGTGSADFTVTYDNGTNMWTCRVTITSIPSMENCAMTQGFYGNQGGVYCDGNFTEDVLDALLSTDLVIAGPVNELIIYTYNADCIIDRLPGSGASVPITEASTCDDPAGIDLHKKRPKRFKNTLVGQTVTLGLNKRLDNALGSVVMTSRFLTTAASSGCGTFNAPNNPMNDDWRYNEIPESVYSYLGTDPTIDDLYDLANDALEGEDVGGLSLEDITNALEAINDGFDGCMFGTFDGGYWPPAELQAPYPELDDLSETDEIEHTAYPNPFIEATTIEFTLHLASNVKVEVFNINGISMGILLDRFVEENITTTAEFSLNNLAQGMYIYVIHTNHGSFYGKIIKQK